MGDAADDIINGDVCEECGEWLGDGAGYPQSCEACSKQNSKSNKKKP